MLKHRPGQGSEAAQREAAHTVCQLPPGDVPWLLQPLHDLLQSRKQKEVRLPVKPRVLFLELTQNVFGKLKFSHTAILLARDPRAKLAGLLCTCSQLFIEWKRRAQRLDFGSRLRNHHLIRGIDQHRCNPVRDLVHLRLLKTPGGRSGRANAEP